MPRTTDSNVFIVEPISAPGRYRWAPNLGPETIDFLNNVVPENSRDRVSGAAVSILSKSHTPSGDAGHETGLVVGYVQSGKTMSFEAVAALACDNSFQMVIVVAGIATALLEQSTRRLRRDLRLDEPDRVRQWMLFQNPSKDDATVQAIRDVLDGWRDPNTPNQFRRTVLITVLKNHLRLKNLLELILTLDVQACPVLIIDDEADQASLNIEVAQGAESTTYRRLMALRQALPTHTYLQYTATPQAPLLVSIIDALSPNFVQVLEPGEEYVGGREFFSTSSSYVRVIPSHDVPTNTNALEEPPESLLAALRVFMMGVTAGICQGHNTGNRSMLVHPSHRTAQHQEYYNWISEVFTAWKYILSLPDNDPDKQELIEDFNAAYCDLAQTAGGALPSFEELVPYLRFAFPLTRILEVNAREGHTPPVDWRSAYGWVLVGGQAMDRGFTVEGLTVTYMPRGLGIGNADTVQQRARFFGYKRSYLGYCRVYLEEMTLHAFRAYVEHEEDVRAQLTEFQENGQPLDDWKRAFVLDTALRPCRQHVLEFDYFRGRFEDQWVTPRVVFASSMVVQANRKAADGFVQLLPFSEDDGHPERTDTQRHQVCRGIPLRAAIEQLLIRIRITGTMDSQRNTGLLLQLSKALEVDSDEVCTIFKISPTKMRHRGIDTHGEITNLFQGAAPVNPRERRGEVYPGDRAIRDDQTVTIQIHTLNLTRGNQVVQENVVVIAVWVPARLASDWIYQHQS